jgi:hypothetical protein
VIALRAVADVVAHDQPGYAGEQRVAERAVHADPVELRRGECVVGAEHLGRDAELADIVDLRTERERVELAGRHARHGAEHAAPRDEPPRVAEAFEFERGAQPHQRRGELARIALLEQRASTAAVGANHVLEPLPAGVAGHLRDPAKSVNEIDHARSVHARRAALGVDRHRTC